MERAASTLKAKEQTDPSSAAIAKIGPVYSRERSADYSRSQLQLSQKLSPDSSPSWILYAARLSCQDVAKDVVASSSCKVGGVSLYVGGTIFMARKLFSLLCGFLAAAAFKGVNTQFQETETKCEQGLEEGSRENPLQDSNVSCFWEN